MLNKSQLFKNMVLEFGTIVEASTSLYLAVLFVTG